MRLWHEALLPYLPRQQLLGQHRECCALRGLGWGKPHSVVNYVFDHPYGWLVAYHKRVIQEMAERGYKADPLWLECGYRGKIAGRLYDDWEENACEECNEASRCRIIYPEHNDSYLQECLDNLAGKGIHIDMGAGK